MKARISTRVFPRVTYRGWRLVSRWAFWLIFGGIAGALIGITAFVASH